MKTILTVLSLWFVTVGFANTAPTPVVTSATMRSGTTYMDVVFRVNDPDDATVKVRALAFIDGVRSFSNAVKPVTFVEGTGVNLGDAIATNTDHTLTWDVAADWNVDLGQIKFEILALDNRGLLEIDWVSIPAAGENPALTISKDTPSNAKVMDALFWDYAGTDPWVTLTDGILKGNASSGVYEGIALATGSMPENYARPYLFKRMNLDPATLSEVKYATDTAGANLLSPESWHAANRPYAGVSVIVGWGFDFHNQATPPPGLTKVIAITGEQYGSLVVNSDGTVHGWGFHQYSESMVPDGLSDVIAIADGSTHSLALKSDGTVVGWGSNTSGQITIPAGLSDVTAIAASSGYSLALKSDGTVVGWGSNTSGQITIPPGLSGVTAIAANGGHSLALKSDGTVVGWGYNFHGEVTIPAGLNGVIAIAAGSTHSLALKSDGTVVAWGYNLQGQTNVPEGLSDVIAISAGAYQNLALKSDGTVVAWGHNAQGQANVPEGLTGVTAIAGAGNHSLALKSETL